MTAQSKKPMNYLLKTLWILSLASTTACLSYEDKADAYGNFETDTRYVSAEVSGKLVTFNLEEGDHVKAHQTLGITDTTQLYLKKRQLSASVAALKSKLQNIPVQLGSLYEQKANVEREILRTQSLLKDSAATQKQLDDLKGDLQVVDKRLAATKNKLSTSNRGILAEMEPLAWQIRQLEDQIAKSEMTAPVKGTILEKFKEPSELITTGQPLLKLADLSEMTLRAFITGNQLGSVKIGQQVTLAVDAPDGQLKTYPATVSWIASEAEFTPKTIQTKEERVNLVYAVKFLTKNDGYLKIGMPGEVRFTTTYNELY